MKYCNLVLLPVAAQAFYLPDVFRQEQSLLQHEDAYKEDTVEHYFDTMAELSSKSVDGALNTVERMGEAFTESLSSLFDTVRHRNKHHRHRYDDEDDDDFDDERRRRHRNRHHYEDDDDFEDERRGRHNHRNHRRPHSLDDNTNDKTIWELIKESDYASKFAKLVEKHKHVKNHLDDTKNDYTVFVPTNDAFEHMEKMHGKISSEFLEEILEYHIVPGRFDEGKIRSVYTMPSVLELRDLGHHHQRLRVGINEGDIMLNFYAKVLNLDIEAKNGMIHTVDHLLVPPPKQGRIVDMYPAYFSTFLLAMEKTGLGKDLHKMRQHGGTVFLPNNEAWMKLGPHTTAWFFSDEGKKYLRALMKYHVVRGETLYSDAFYDKERKKGKGMDDDDYEDENGFMGDEYRRHKHHRHSRTYGDDDIPDDGQYNVELPSFLGNKKITVDINKQSDNIDMMINNKVVASILDGISEDGVVHVVESVLMPPPGKQWDPNDPGNDYENDQMPIKDIKKRLEKFVGKKDYDDVDDWFDDL